MATLLVFLILLSVLILVHELGHFFAAKKLGVVAEEFGLGLPPRVRRLFSWKRTEFTLNWLPIGGFVRMRGEDADNSEFRIQNSELVKRGYFYAQKPWKRAVILIAGVTMNLIFGIAAFTVVYSFLGIPTETDKVIVQGVAPGSPADQAQLHSGEAVLELKVKSEKLKVKDTNEFVKLVNENRGQEITLVVSKDGTTREAVLVPRLESQTPENEGALGVAISNLEFVRYPWWQMPFRATVTGAKEALGWSVNIVAGLGSMVSQLVIHGRLPKDVAGPVGIAYIAGNVARQGWLALTQFAGILSVNLAIVNLLPFPALDGGRLLFLGIEKLRGRPLNPAKERWVHLIGYGILITLILLATVQDILRILSS
ncbi:MAG: Peptidase M50 [Candidatus Magasanikbacteria bacterium GW2011_GWA2_45_39]|uniref:Peptidase M50 n=1 Tax=Candidatus Magasanikbacteria bacterium GW2011_GWA2_45_39 TaxID=1619041 RepID=A0A0G1PMJ6_9BACT|nr:MAG: Peptidase M50 [Candidatus Magasanikbacteria bacterium GW2011_GWA2_45_39]